MPLRRDPELRVLERQLQEAVRDALHQGSRKPFCWGGLKGYRQLEALAGALGEVPGEPETGYLRLLGQRVQRAVEENRLLAEDLGEAQAWLLRVAECLGYPPKAVGAEARRGSEAVRQAMEALLARFPQDLREKPAQAGLYRVWRRLWRNCGEELLPCYDQPGVPQDNLQLEARFGKLRNGQRRVSGRQSTRPLRDLGHYQVLFQAQSEAELRQQLQQTRYEEYRRHRKELAEAEGRRLRLYRLHRWSASEVCALLGRHAARRARLFSSDPTPSADTS